MEKKYVTLKNGETYAYVERGLGDEVLLLIHGNLSSSIYFKPLIKRLPANYHIIALDLRGFGDTSYNQRFTSLKELADDVNDFLEALEIKKANVLGWSLGGGVAMQLAAHYPDKIKKLILMNSPSHKGFPAINRKEVGKSIVTEAYALAEEMAEELFHVKPLEDAIEDRNFGFLNYIYDSAIYTNKKPLETENEVLINETLKQRNLTDAEYALANLNMSNTPTIYNKGESSISNINAPVLHIWGTLDKSVPERMVLENIDALKDQSKYIKFEQCGHCPLVDKPNELANAVVEFLND